MKGVKRTPQTIAADITIDANNGIIWNQELYEKEMQLMLDEQIQQLQSRIKELEEELHKAKSRIAELELTNLNISDELRFGDDI